MQRAEKEADTASYSNDIITKATSISRGMQNWTSSILLYLGTRNKLWRERFERLSEELPNELHVLASGVTKNSEDAKDLDLAAEILQYLRATVAEGRAYLRTNFSYLEVLKLKQQLRLGIQPRMTELSEVLDRIISRHSYQAQQSPAMEQRKKSRFKLLLLGGFLLNILATFIMVLGFNKGITKRISIIADNFTKFKKSSALNPPQAGSDEISFLDKSFHELASALSEVAAKDRAIFANMPVGLIACDRSASIESVNPCAESLLGLRSSDMVGRSFSDFLMQKPETTLSQSDKVDLSLLKPDKYYLRRASDKGFPAHISLSKYQHAGQDKLLFSFVDLSDREEIEKMKQEFISIISHDLRAPLSSIKGCLLMLDQGALGELPEQAKTYVGLASQESERLIRLTGDLLEMARIESGHIVLEKRSAFCSEIMEQAITAVRALAESKGMKINVTPSPLSILADPDRICQILVNFLSNAIKYSDANSQVKLSAEAVDSYIQLNVVDEGRGIPANLVPSVFDRFKQVRAEDSKDGAGLGLAICKLLAEAHGGSVGVDTEMTKGCKFWVRLPAT
jgi:PAS domain S-box-containing protein